MSLLQLSLNGSVERDPSSTICETWAASEHIVSGFWLEEHIGTANVLYRQLGPTVVMYCIILLFDAITVYKILFWIYSEQGWR